MQGVTEYIKDNSVGIEVVSYEQVSVSFPEHTHTGHYIIGIVTDGEVNIEIADKHYICSKGNLFSVPPDVCHAIKPVTKQYSMLSICIPTDRDISRNLGIIKEKILGNPELEFNVESMAREVYISPYHMIRNAGINFANKYNPSFPACTS